MAVSLADFRLRQYAEGTSFTLVCSILNREHLSSPCRRLLVLQLSGGAKLLTLPANKQGVPLAAAPLAAVPMAAVTWRRDEGALNGRVLGLAVNGNCLNSKLMWACGGGSGSSGDGGGGFFPG